MFLQSSLEYIYNFNITSYCEKLTLKTQLECIIR